MKTTQMLFAVVVLLLVVAVPGYSDSLLTFDGSIGGTITASGANFSGSLIPLPTLFVSGALTGNGTYDLSGPAGGSASFDFDTSGTTYFSVTGAILGLGISESVLLSGKIPNFSFDNSVTDLLALSLSGPDPATGTLLSHLSLLPNTRFDLFGTTFTAFSFSDDNNYTPVSYSVIASQVPEPEPLLLLGSGLISLATFAIKRIVS